MTRVRILCKRGPRGPRLEMIDWTHSEIDRQRLIADMLEDDDGDRKHFFAFKDGCQIRYLDDLVDLLRSARPLMFLFDASLVTDVMSSVEIERHSVDDFVAKLICEGDREDVSPPKIIADTEIVGIGKNKNELIPLSTIPSPPFTPLLTPDPTPPGSESSSSEITPIMPRVDSSPIAIDPHLLKTHLERETSSDPPIPTISSEQGSGGCKPPLESDEQKVKRLLGGFVMWDGVPSGMCPMIPNPMQFVGNSGHGLNALSLIKQPVKLNSPGDDDPAAVGMANSSLCLLRPTCCTNNTSKVKCSKCRACPECYLRFPYTACTDQVKPFTKGHRFVYDCHVCGKRPKESPTPELNRYTCEKCVKAGDTPKPPTIVEEPAKIVGEKPKNDSSETPYQMFCLGCQFKLRNTEVACSCPADRIPLAREGLTLVLTAPTIDKVIWLFGMTDLALIHVFLKNDATQVLCLSPQGSRVKYEEFYMYLSDLAAKINVVHVRRNTMKTTMATMFRIMIEQRLKYLSRSSELLDHTAGATAGTDKIEPLIDAQLTQPTSIYELIKQPMPIPPDPKAESDALLRRVKAAMGIGPATSINPPTPIVGSWTGSIAAAGTDVVPGGPRPMAMMGGFKQQYAPAPYTEVPVPRAQGPPGSLSGGVAGTYSAEPPVVLRTTHILSANEVCDNCGTNPCSCCHRCGEVPCACNTVRTEPLVDEPFNPVPVDQSVRSFIQEREPPKNSRADSKLEANELRFVGVPKEKWRLCGGTHSLASNYMELPIFLDECTRIAVMHPEGCFASPKQIVNHRLSYSPKVTIIYVADIVHRDNELDIPALKQTLANLSDFVHPGPEPKKTPINTFKADQRKYKQTVPTMY